MDLNDEDDFIEKTDYVEADHVNIETDANLAQASDINSTPYADVDDIYDFYSSAYPIQTPQLNFTFVTSNPVEQVVDCQPVPEPE
jgi:hypothetical protein